MLSVEDFDIFKLWNCHAGMEWIIIPNGSFHSFVCEYSEDYLNGIHSLRVVTNSIEWTLSFCLLFQLFAEDLFEFLQSNRNIFAAFMWEMMNLQCVLQMRSWTVGKYFTNLFTLSNEIVWLQLEIIKFIAAAVWRAEF